MQIACPQCSMEYDLDPRLLPPAGASVQCSRCRFVFTATPSGEVLVPGSGQNPSRPSVGTKTGIFGSPGSSGSKQGAPNTQTTQIFGAVPPPAADAESAPGGRTPAFGSATAGTHLPPGSKTQVFAAPGAPAPSTSTTQVFGAPAGLAKAPPATTTQVFGAASAPLPPPSATTTQVFGAPSGPPPSPSTTTTQVFGAPPGLAKAPPAATTQVFGAASVPPQPPPAATTQVFGAAAVAAKASVPSTTQVFGAASIPGQPPSGATTQAFGAAEVQAARSRGGESGRPPSTESAAPTPWLAEPGPAVKPARTITSPAGMPVPAPAVELPDEPVPLPDPAHAFISPEPEMSRSGPIAASRRAPAVELPPELIVPERSGSARPAAEQASGGGKERIFIILAAMVALGLTAWLSYPVWRNQGSELPVEALSAKDEAVSLMRRDDVASRQQAIQQLTTLVGRYPKFTEAQAELVVALALQLDDVKVERDWVSQQAGRLQREISALELSKSPADWSGRVTARNQERATLGEQRRALDASAADLTKKLESALVVIRAAPETEPSADVVARVKAQAISEAVNGTPQAVALAERLKKVESRPNWSVLALAEYGLNANSPPSTLPALAEDLAHVRERDQTFFRAYVLGARLALRQNDPATAQTLLDAVLALNPNHALARTLQKWAATAAPTP